MSHLCTFTVSPMRATWPIQLILFDFIILVFGIGQSPKTQRFRVFIHHRQNPLKSTHPGNVRRGVQIKKLLIMYFSPTSCYFCPLECKSSLERSVLKHPHCVLPLEWERQAGKSPLHQTGPEINCWKQLSSIKWHRTVWQKFADIWNPSSGSTGSNQQEELPTWQPGTPIFRLWIYGPSQGQHWPL
jgi:hypothetical protein